jgi:agmatinase
MFYHAINEGLIDPDHSIQIGIRTSNDDQMGMKCVSAELVHLLNYLAIAERIARRVGDKKAYLTFDIDCLDPSVAPGTGTPVCGGLFMHQTQMIIKSLSERSINVVGMDVMEVSPPYDHAEITSLAAATIALDLLCFQASS